MSKGTVPVTTGEEKGSNNSKIDLIAKAFLIKALENIGKEAKDIDWKKDGEDNKYMKFCKLLSEDIAAWSNNNSPEELEVIGTNDGITIIGAILEASEAISIKSNKVLLDYNNSFKNMFSNALDGIVDDNSQIIQEAVSDVDNDDVPGTVITGTPAHPITATTPFAQPNQYISV